MGEERRTAKHPWRWGFARRARLAAEREERAMKKFRVTFDLMATSEEEAVRLVER